MGTHDQFTPEEAQQQNKLLIQDLGHYYDTHTEDSASLARVRERLLKKTATSLPVADAGKIIQFQTRVQTRRERGTRRESRHPSASGKARHPYLTTLAAAVLVAVLLGSFALVLQRQRTNGGSRQPEAPPIGDTLSSCASQPIQVLVDLCTHHQLTNLRQSRKMGTYVIELERAYLDMNQLVITYRVFSQSTGRQMLTWLTDTLVTTSQGLSFGRNTENSPVGRMERGGATGPAVVQFSTPAVPADTHVFHFQVKVKSFQFQLPQLPSAGPPLRQPPVVHGSATFDFTLLYHDGLVVRPHQTVTAHGSSVTLERVLISPSETIVVGTTKGTIPNLPDYTFWLHAAGRNPGSSTSAFGGRDNPFSIEYDDGLLGQHGTWTFEISSASGQAGPWMFHFSVP